MRLLLLAWLASMSIVMTGKASADDALWESIRQGGHIVLMRHALAPGNGDPSNFDVNDCATQRNLSDEGRQQARRTGQRFRDQGIDRLIVYSSQWCRCAETARLLDLGDVTPSPALNSFYESPTQRNEKTQAALALISDHSTNHADKAPTLLLVTHQVNISALTGTFANSGEMVIVKYSDGELKPVGRME